MTITEAICTGNSRYRANEALTPVGVVLHSIGTPQPSAQVLRDYWQRDASPYIVHYMVDDTQILHCMPDDRKCWHVGTPGNSKWLGIEMGEPPQIRYTSGASFTVSDLEAAQAYVRACYQNAVWLLAKLCKDHGWNPLTAIYTHYEVTRQKLSNTDHTDPQHLWNGLGMGYDLAALRRDVAAAIGSAATPAAPDTAGAASPMYRIRKSWEDAASQIGAYTNLAYAKAACKDGYAVFDASGKQVWPEAAFTPYLVRIAAQSGLNVRKGPGTSYGIVTALGCGGAYTVVDEQDGWGLLKAYQTARNGWICLKYTERVV